MLQQIMIHTPVWVWLLLAFLLYRGWLAAFDREVSVRSVIIIPLLMLGLSCNGLVKQFHAEALAMGMAFLVALLAAAWGWHAADNALLKTHPSPRKLYLRGSWLPLLIMVSIFVVKYTVNVTQAVQPAALSGVLPMVMTSGLYGLFAGVSVGRMLRILHLCRQAQPVMGQLQS